MKIGIIGSGNVGGTLGSRWAANGRHQVVFSSRHPDSPEMKELLARAGSTASAGTIQEAVASSDVILLATPWQGTKDALEIAGPLLVGKILVDATNPLLPDLSGLEAGTTTSGGELVAQWAPGAHVVKAFNTIGFGIMANPHFGNAGDAVLFYCGDDSPAKEIVHQLAVELGFDAHDAGPLRQARLLEPFALLWISLAMKGTRDMAFRFMKR